MKARAGSEYVQEEPGSLQLDNDSLWFFMDAHKHDNVNTFLSAFTIDDAKLERAPS